MTWVHEGIFAAGGDHLPGHWADFAAQTGVSAVLHLCPDRPQPFAGPPPEAFLWLNLADEAQADLDTRLLAGAFVDSCLSEGRRVLLHSSLGRHRTRWAFVAFRILRGSSPRAALRLAAERPWLAPYSTDAALWEAFALLARRRRSGSTP